MDETQRLIRAYCEKRDRQKKYYWEHYDKPLNTAGAKNRHEWRGNPSFDEGDYKPGGRLHGRGRGPDKDE